jgi:hypothetical protein
MHGLGYPGNLVYLLTAIGGCFFVGSRTNTKRVWAENLVHGGVDRSSVLTGPNVKMRSFNGNTHLQKEGMVKFSHFQIQICST